MKQSIKWHEECLINLTESAKRKSAEADRATKECQHIWGLVRRLELQIESARKQKKDGFDSDKYLKPSPPKSTGCKG